MTRSLAPLLGALLLVSCATLPPPTTENTPESQQKWLERTELLNRITTWKYDGRIAVRVADDGWNASVTWAQYDQVFEISLQGPFGAGAVSILGSPAGVRITSGDDPPLIGSSADNLLREKTGVSLPIRSLEFWAVGKPDPETESTYDLDANGKVIRLSQLGWTVDYKNYAATNSGVELPRKIFASNNKIGIRLVIDQWTLN